MNKLEYPANDGIAALLQGARSFREREYGGVSSQMRNLANAQQPGVTMISCADSRVDPALLFGARPGQMQVVRVVANLVPPPGSGGLEAGVFAALELGLRTLEIPHLIVCGHSNCVGVRTALDQAARQTPADSSCLHDWTSTAGPVCREVIAEHGELSVEELSCYAEQRLVLESLKNLRAQPWLRERENRGDLTLHGWWFDIASGNLWIADPQTGNFQAQ